jgi:hypothetical protein
VNTVNNHPPASHAMGTESALTKSSRKTARIAVDPAFANTEIKNCFASSAVAEEITASTENNAHNASNVAEAASVDTGERKFHVGSVD